MFIFDVSSVISFKDYQTFLQNLKSRFDSRKTELLKTVNFYENAEWKHNLSCYIKFRDRTAVNAVLKSQRRKDTLSQDPVCQ